MSKAKALFDVKFVRSSNYAFYAPHDILNPLAQAVGARSDGTGGFDIDCHAAVPPLTFEFDGTGQKVSVLPEEMVVKNPTGNVCKLNIHIGFDEIPIDPPLVVVGAPLMRSYCTVFDMLNNRIAFASLRIP